MRRKETINQQEIRKGGLSLNTFPQADMSPPKTAIHRYLNKPRAKKKRTPSLSRPHLASLWVHFTNHWSSGCDESSLSLAGKTICEVGGLPGPCPAVSGAGSPFSRFRLSPSAASSGPPLGSKPRLVRLWGLMENCQGGGLVLVSPSLLRRVGRWRFSVKTLRWFKQRA